MDTGTHNVPQMIDSCWNYRKSANELIMRGTPFPAPRLVGPHRSIPARAGEYLMSASPDLGGMAVEWISPDLMPSAHSDQVFSVPNPDTGNSRTIRRLAVTDGGISSQPFYSAWHPPSQELTDGGQIRVNLQGGPVKVEAFFPRMRLGRMPDGGLVVVDSSAYELKIVAPDGRISSVLRRPVDPLLVTPGLRRDAQDQRRQEFLDIRAFEDAYRRISRAIDNMSVFPEVQVITGIKVGWEGQLWVQCRGDDPFQDDGPIDVISTSGSYVGTFEQGEFPMPDALGPQRLAAFVETNELDVDAVVVRRLPLTVGS